MNMKKLVRKVVYHEIISLMLKGETKKAYNKLVHMCAEDTGLYIFTEYDEAIEKLNKEASNPLQELK